MKPDPEKVDTVCFMDPQVSRKFVPSLVWPHFYRDSYPSFHQLLHP